MNDMNATHYKASVTMTTTRRLSQEEIEALIDLRIAQLRVLAAQTAVEWWRSRERERDERVLAGCH